MKKILLIKKVIMFILIITCSFSYAKEYFVSPDGSNTNDGTITNPWKTIQYAIDNSGPGDTVYLRGGTYPDEVIWIRGIKGNGGTAGNYWTLKNYNNEKVILIRTSPFKIDAPYVKLEGLIFYGVNRDQGPGLTVQNTKDYNTLKWDPQRAHDVILKNLEFYGGSFRYAAISIQAYNVIVDNVYIHDINQKETTDHGIYIHMASNITIKNSDISGAEGFGIHIYDEIKKSSEPDNYRLIENIIIENNLLHNNHSAGVFTGTGTTNHPLVNNVIIRNNIIYQNDLRAIEIRKNSKNIYIYNNTIYNTDNYGIRIAGCCGSATTGTLIENIYIYNNIINVNNNSYHIYVGKSSEIINNIVLKKNLYWPSPINLYNITSELNPIIKDPLFLNVLSNDVHLKSKSPAIDAGISLPEVTTDFDGNPRPMDGDGDGIAKPDIGAFEYTGTYVPPQIDTTPPSPPILKQPIIK